MQLLAGIKGKPTLTLQEIIAILSGKGRTLIVVVLSLPFLLPVTIPGLSLLFGIVIAFLGIRMAYSRHVWLPKKLLLKPISSHKIEKMVGIALRFMKKIRPFLHSRLIWLCQGKFSWIINGLLTAFLGLFLALPLPIPFSNLAPGWALFLINLGALEDDGVFVLLGYIMSLATIIFFLFLFLSLKKIL